MVRSGGRTETNRKAVADAVLKLVTGGNLLFDIQDVADLSGVHRTTIRRRWGDREALLAEAMSEHISRLTVDPSGDWETVFRRTAFALRDFMRDPVEDALNRLIPLSGDNPFTQLVRRHWAQLYADLAAPLVAAQRKGQLAQDVDVLMALQVLASTIMTYIIYAPATDDDRFVERLVQQTLRGMRRPA
jgi:AcrR family transcriptional regulator